MIKTLLLGPGAIGSLLCWHWQSRANIRVFPHRPGLSLPTAVIDSAGEHRLDWQWPAEGEPFNEVELVLVSCKATQVEAAVTPLLPLLPQASWLIACNGLGPQQWLAEQAPGRVLWASTTEGARPQGDGRIHRSGEGRTLIGPASGTPLTADSAALGQRLLAAGPLPLEWRDDLLPTLWLKLAVNAVINPLTAAHGIANGELTQAQWRTEIETLCAEIQAVAAACGQSLPGNLAERVLGVAAATAGNHSSMRLDVEAGRATEIEFINGYLLRQGFEAGVKTPRLAHWYQRLLSLDSPGT